MQSELTERAKTAWNSIADEFNQWDALGLDEQETYVALTAALSEQTQQGVEEIRRLDDALCNFINAYGDPYEPAEDYEAETERNIKELSDAYNDAHVAGVFSGRAALVDVPAVAPVAGYRRRLPQYAFEHYEFEQPGYESPSISDWETLYSHPPHREGEDSAEVVTLTRAEADRIAQRLEFDASWDKCGDGYYSIKRQLGALAATRSGSASEGGGHG